MSSVENHKNTVEKMAKEFGLVQQGQALNDWFVFREERHFGPLTSDQINKLLIQRKISIHHHIWRPGFAQWLPISEIENFRACGVESIDFIDDNTFSQECELEAVDLIAPDIHEIRFSKSWIKKVAKQRQILSEKIHLLSTALGLSDETKAYLARYTVVAALACVTSMFVLFLWPSNESVMDGLAKSMQSHLLRISKQPESTVNVQFAAFEKSNGQSDPVLVMASNLPLGSNLQIKLVGEPETLLGALNFEKTMETTVKEKIFSTPPIRGRNGQFIPAGVYSFKVVCLSCGPEKKTIFEQQYSLGIQNVEDYQSKLKFYHQKVRQDARLELTELDSLASVLNEQYKKTLNGFVKFNNGVVSWERFSGEWLENQNRVVGVFAQMESEDVREHIYYLPLYESYKQLAKNIFELHMMQDSLVKTSKNKGFLTKDVAALSHKISLNLTYLKSQIDLMSTEAQSAEGLPSKEALKKMTL